MRPDAGALLESLLNQRAGDRRGSSRMGVTEDGRIRTVRESESARRSRQRASPRGERAEEREETSETA